MDDLTDRSSSSVEDDCSGSDYESDYSSDAAAEQLLNEHRRASMRPDDMAPRILLREERVTAGEVITDTPGPSDVFSHGQYTLVITYAMMDLFLNAPENMKQDSFSRSPLLSLMMFLHWTINGTGPCGFVYLTVVCFVLGAMSLGLTAMKLLGLRRSCPRTLSSVNSQLRQKVAQIMRQLVFAFGWRHGGDSAFWYCALMLIVSGYATARNMQILKRFGTKKRSVNIYSSVVMIGLIFAVVSVDVSQTHPWAVAKWYAGHSVGTSDSGSIRHSGVRMSVCNPHDLEPATVTWHTKFSQQDAVVTYAAIGCNYLASEVPTYETTMVTTTTREKPVLPKDTSIAPIVTFSQKTDTSKDTSSPVTSLSQESSKSKDSPVISKSSSNKSSSLKKSSARKATPISVANSQSVATSEKADSAVTAKSSVGENPHFWGTFAKLFSSAKRSQVTTSTEEDIVSSVPITSFQVESDNIPLSLTETDSSLAVNEPSHPSFEVRSSPSIQSVLTDVSQKSEAPQTEMTKDKLATSNRSKSPVTKKAQNPETSKASASKHSAASGSTTWTITNAEKAEEDRTTLWVFDDTWTTRLASQLGILRT